MYAKGAEGLRNLDLALASLRQKAQRESCATHEEVRCAMILEDVHLQAEQRCQRGGRQQQQLQLESEGRQLPGSSGSLPAHRLSGVGASSRILTVPRTVDCVHEPVKTDPPWYDGQYTPLKDHEKTRVDHNSSVSCETTNEVSEDVALRVTRAARTLYPALIAAVTKCALEQEQEQGEMYKTRVVEWDKRGAPVRLQSVWRCSSPSQIVPGTSLENAVGGDVIPTGRAHANEKRITPETTVAHIDKAVCEKLYEYKPNSNPFRSALFATTHANEGGKRRSIRGTTGMGRMQPQRKPSTTPHCNIPGGNGPKLCTEGTAVAKSSGSGIAKRIRQQVLANNARNCSENDRGDDHQSSPNVVNSRSLSRCTTARESEVLKVVYTQVVNPLTVFFCTSCGACAARDVSSGLPDMCCTCGEPFGEMPLPPTSAGSCIDGTPMPKCSVTPQGRSATAGAAPPVSVKESCTKEKETSTTTADAATHSALSYSLQLPVFSTRGLYFMHLWDQVAAHR